jgi:hypothetical protein
MRPDPEVETAAVEEEPAVYLDDLTINEPGGLTK